VFSNLVVNNTAKFIAQFMKTPSQNEVMPLSIVSVDIDCDKKDSSTGEEKGE